MIMLILCVHKWPKHGDDDDDDAFKFFLLLILQTNQAVHLCYILNDKKQEHPINSLGDTL